MPSDPQGALPGLEDLQRALARGDADGIRAAIQRLDPREQRVLEARLGASEVGRLVARAWRGIRRGARLGKVIVIHGIMGGLLDSVEPDGDVERIWLSYLRLAFGQLDRLELMPDGTPAKPDLDIRVAGIFPEYLSLVTELAERWEVLPFAFDWRKDIDESADRLAGAIERFAGTAPVHVVAHSMGGLVARRMIQRHAALWNGMADGTSLARGGRLVMLGTPNRGSFSIPLVLTGAERTVRLLELLDVRHDMPALLRIIGTFPGVYQMLPSPVHAAVDDRASLFEGQTWGRLPISPVHLKRGAELQRELDAVTDAHRLVYVAGYDQPTPFRIKVERPGDFRYQETRDGDGRVPHELGLLEGVPTLWVKEAHGDLPRNESVLAGIHDLLARGTTDALERERPARRELVPEQWRTAASVAGDVEDLVGQELAARLRAAARRGGKRGPASADLAPDDGVRIEAGLAAAGLGGGGAGARGPVGGARGAETAAAPRASPAKLRVRVCWDDITRVRAGVYAVGHYQGVLPQNAEKALDCFVSSQPASNPDDSRLVLTRLTRRGVLRGALGDINFFPVRTRPAGCSTVAVAGMGYPGTFGAPELRRLARTLASAVTALPRVKIVASVLIGSGDGSGAGALSTAAAVESYLVGFAEGLDAQGQRGELKEVVFVDTHLDKAFAVHAAVEDLVARPELASRVSIELAPLDVPPDARTKPGPAFCRGVVLAAAAAATNGKAVSRRALDTLLSQSPELSRFRETTLEALTDLAPKVGGSLAKLAAQLGSRPRRDDPTRRDSSIRLSFHRRGETVVASALTDSVVIPERAIPMESFMLQGMIRELTDPAPERVATLGQRLARLLIPRDFRRYAPKRNTTTIFEVDRSMASVPWELLASEVDGELGASTPLALDAAVSRQLRTTYSPPPSAAPPLRWPLRALVIGDPGDAAHSLPGAAREAQEVAELLRRLGVDEVEVLIGAPGSRRPGFEPAELYGVIARLIDGGYDLLHYAGHAGFDRDNPERAGWLFEGGVLTASQIERVDLAPRLVVANACLSGQTSDRYRTAAGSDGPRLDADVLPSLADGFFQRGVRDYVGTAWPVNDLGAMRFAKAFYEKLLDRSGRPATIGEALVAGRRVLAAEPRFGTLWAAYQHYGDPFQTVAAPAATSGRAREPKARATAGAKSGGHGESAQHRPARESVGRRSSKRARSKRRSNRRS